MVAFAVVLLLVAVVLIGLGLVLYGNGVGEIPDDVGGDVSATRRGVGQISRKELFARMRTSVREMTDANASRDRRLAATGAFCVLFGLILVALAVVAFIAAFA
jgi:hypothetical protein